MAIDWKKEAERLSRYWWGPKAPGDYVVGRRSDSGQLQLAGPGLLATPLKGRPDYRSAWNLMLLAWGRYEPPTTLEHAQAMVHLLVVAHQTAGVLVQGHPLGTYTWLMPPEKFGQWVLTPSVAAVVGLQAGTLSRQCTRLVGAPV